MKITKRFVGVACLGVLLITGCASIEEQIASNDPRVHAQGVSRARDAAIADMWASCDERIARVKQIDSDDVLCQVIIGISSQRKRDYIKGITGEPFDIDRSSEDEARGCLRINANIAVIKAAAEGLKNPSREQLYDLFAVATKYWEVSDTPKHSGRRRQGGKNSTGVLLQVLDGLAMRFEKKEVIFTVLKDSERYESKFWLPDTTRFKLYQKYIARENELTVLKEIAESGWVSDVRLESSKYKRLNQLSAIKKITDGETLVELVKKVDAKDEKAIFSRLVALKAQKSLAKLFTEYDATRFFEEKDRDSQDITQAKAAELIALFSNKAVIASLATRARSFQIRSCAIDKLEDQTVLKKIAEDADMGALQKQAIKKLTDAGALKGLRQTVKNDEIKKCVSARMAELGISSVNDIVAAKKYSKYLLEMVDEISDTKDLQKIVGAASLRGVKILAAAKLGEEKAIAEAKKQMAAIKDKPTSGQFVIDGFYLGMPIEDAFAILWVKHHEVKPSLYVDEERDTFLNISMGSKYPCDFAWAKISDMAVCRLTFTPDLVGKIIGFKGGSFTDMESAVENHLGVTFGDDILESRLQWSLLGVEQINCRIASQKICSIASVGDETLRFFAGDREVDRNLQRNVMQSSRRNGWDSSISNALKSLGEYVDDSLKDVDIIFAHRGSIRICKTNDAPKGLLKASGSFGKPSGVKKRVKVENILNSDRGNISGALDDAKNKVEDLLNNNMQNIQNAIDTLGGLGL